MYTEDDAKTKGCCDGGNGDMYCGASKCMGWRWDDTTNTALKVEGGEMNDMVGYCGLAGKP